MSSFTEAFSIIIKLLRLFHSCDIIDKGIRSEPHDQITQKTTQSARRVVFLDYVSLQYNP